MRDINYILKVSNNADNDLKKIPNRERIEVFINYISERQDLLDLLTKWDEEHNAPPAFNVKAIASFHKRKLNIYRIRPLLKDIKNYRIIYAFNQKENEFYVLAVIDRNSYDYDLHDPISNRIIEEHDSLGLLPYSSH